MATRKFDIQLRDKARNLLYPIAHSDSGGNVIATAFVKKSGDTMTDSLNIGSNTTSSEKYLRVETTSGSILLDSVGNSGGNGKRGVWLGAHGTATSGKWAIEADTNNNVTLNGTATSVSIATTAPTTTTNYALPITTTVSGSAALKSCGDQDLGNQLIKVQLKDGTTSSDGMGILVLGNGINSGTAHNAEGVLALYSTGTASVLLRATNGMTTSRNIYLPDAAGTIALTTSNVASATKVAQTLTTSNKEYPILLAPNGQTSSDTSSVYFSTYLNYNPSNGLIINDLRGITHAANTLYNVMCLKFKNADNTVDYTGYPISFIGTDGTDGYNTAIRLGSINGPTWVTSGESGNTLPVTITGGGYNNEKLYLSSDTEIEFYTGVANNASSYKHTATMDTSGNVNINDGYLKVTKNDNTVTIGSQNANWCHIYNSANIPFIFNNTVAVRDNGDLGTSNLNYHWNNAYFKGTVLINSGKDLIFKASSETGYTNDPGDIIFQNSSGTEVGRFWKHAGGNEFRVRFNGTDVGFKVYHSGNITYGSGTPSGGESGDIYIKI